MWELEFDGTSWVLRVDSRLVSYEDDQDEALEIAKRRGATQVSITEKDGYRHSVQLGKGQW